MRKASLLALAQIAYRSGQPESRRLRQLHALQWLANSPEGVTVTADGREALRLGAVEAEAISASALGNYNVALERARPEVAERHLDKSQIYLDLANVFRGKGF
jgi:hypothetical protein